MSGDDITLTHTDEVTTMSGRSRALREKKTVQVMVELYCRFHHGGPDSLCPECTRLLEYSHRRIDGCPLLERKPTCVKCKIHCYDKARREQIRQIMRHSGPRMLHRHPVLAILHMVDGRRG